MKYGWMDEPMEEKKLRKLITGIRMHVVAVQMRNSGDNDNIRLTVFLIKFILPQTPGGTKQTRINSWPSYALLRVIRPNVTVAVSKQESFFISFPLIPGYLCSCRTHASYYSLPFFIPVYPGLLFVFLLNSMQSQHKRILAHHSNRL
jgi:hypothetical protein